MLLCRLSAPTILRSHYALTVAIPLVRHPDRGVRTSVRKHEWNQRAAVNFDVLGAWNNRIEQPVDISQSIKSGKLVTEVSLEKVGVVSLLGRREVNEDRYCMLQLDPQLLMFGVFDGHGGSLAADYVCEHLPNQVRNILNTGEKNLQVILRQAFLNTNEAFARFVKEEVSADGQVTSGTTATVGLLRHSNELVMGHVGDSKAVMCRVGKVVRLTQDHNPENNMEKQRIKAAGGHITWTSTGSPRVNGKLNMTRSIGDLDLKGVGVTAEPETRSIEVKHWKDAFLVLTSDGITDVVGDQEMVSIVASCKTPLEGAQLLTDQALHFGSRDNVTALVVPFGSWGTLDNSQTSVPFSFIRNVVGSRFA